MTRFQLVGFRIQALARLGQSERALREAAQALRDAERSGALQAVPAIEMALMIAQLIGGDLDAASAQAQALLRMPHLHTLAAAHETLAQIAQYRRCQGAGRSSAGLRGAVSAAIDTRSPTAVCEHPACACPASDCDREGRPAHCRVAAGEREAAHRRSAT